MCVREHECVQVHMYAGFMSICVCTLMWQPEGNMLSTLFLRQDLSLAWNSMSSSDKIQALRFARQKLPSLSHLPRPKIPTPPLRNHFSSPKEENLGIFICWSCDSGEIKGTAVVWIAQPAVYTMVTSDRNCVFFFLWGMVTINDGFIKGRIAP